MALVSLVIFIICSICSLKKGIICCCYVSLWDWLWHFSYIPCRISFSSASAGMLFTNIFELSWHHSMLLLKATAACGYFTSFCASSGEDNVVWCWFGVKIFLVWCWFEEWNGWCLSGDLSKREIITDGCDKLKTVGLSRALVSSFWAVTWCLKGVCFLCFFVCFLLLSFFFFLSFFFVWCHQQHASISGTDVLEQFYMLPHRDRSCRSSMLCRHQASLALTT